MTDHVTTLTRRVCKAFGEAEKAENAGEWQNAADWYDYADAQLNMLKRLTEERAQVAAFRSQA